MTGSHIMSGCDVAPRRGAAASSGLAPSNETM
jgi:hypothetical protein